MKKIRFLAALLVILMLPLSVLFGCNKPDEDPDNDDPDVNENEGENNNQGGGGNGGGNDDDISSKPTDNDGLSGNGYLVMFNFDVAKRGDFPDVVPYSRYIKPTANQKGTIYIIDDKGGKNGSGALLIQRTGSNAASSVAFMTTALGGTFGTQHTLEFDIKLGKGLLGDTLEVRADKGSGQTLLSFTPDGKILDCDGTVVFETDKLSEWVHIALCVDDRARTYSTYVNGVKKNAELAFSNSAYPTTDLTQYMFKLAGDTYVDTYCYLDNMAFIDGLVPKEHTSNDIVYKDYYTQKFDVLTASKTDANGNVFPNLDGLLAAYASTKLDVKVSSTPYTSSSMLSMAQALTIVKLDSNGTVVDEVYTDYGVLMGLYDYGEPVGGKLYVSGEGEDAKYIDFNSNKGLTFDSKNILGDGQEISGKYSVYGTETAVKVKLTYGEKFDKVLYCQINDGVLSTYADEKFQTQTATGYSCVSEPFNKVEYSYSDDTVKLSILVNAYTGKASIVINDGTLDVDASDATFAYDADTKILSVTVGDDTYEFTYNEEIIPEPEEGSDETPEAIPATFSYTLGDDVKTLTKTVFEEYIPAEEADSYEYAVRYQNFSSGVADLSIMVDTTNFNPEHWQRVKFEYYISEEMANDSYQFLAYLDTGTSATGWSYLSSVIKHTIPGWYELDIAIGDMQVNRNGVFETFTGKVDLAMGGWSNGPTGSSGTATDGYALYIRNFQFVSNVAVVVDGPDEPAEGEDPCEHIDEDGNTLMVPVAERVEPTCSVGGYALVKCSVCNATMIDDTKVIYDPVGHDYTDAAVLTEDATCTKNGYTYHYCNTCGEFEQIDILEAVGHDIVNNYIAQTKTVVSTCRVCGVESEVKLSDSLMAFEDKISQGGLESSEYFYISNTVNSTLDIGGYEIETEAPTNGIAQLQCKFTKGTAVQLPDGTYAYKLQRAPGTKKDSYVDFLLNKKFGEGGHFVCEFDFRLGGANANGEYDPMSANLIERVTADGGPTSIGIFSISKDGVLTFSQNADAAITLSPDKFTNIALVFKCTENAIDVYVDGYKEYTVPMAAPEKAEYVASMPWSQLRITYSSSITAGEGQYQYFNNLAAYEGNYPICILGFDGAGGMNEFGGSDILLEDEAGEAATYPLAVVDTDKVLKLPEGVNTGKYVLTFKLSAEAALADGNLLIGQKEDEHKWNDNVLALLTVESGWLYFGDTIITSLENIGEGIEIKMAFNEAEGGANVYVNGVEVSGGFISYPAVNAGNYYTDPESRIRSFTFDSEVGAYTISDLTLRAGE